MKQVIASPSLIGRTFAMAMVVFAQCSISFADQMPEVRTVVLTGDPAEGTGPDVQFNTLGVPALNEAGQVAFRGFVAGTDVNGSNDGGIWSEGSGAGLELIVREDDAAPGMPAGTNYWRFEDPVVNGAGQIAFRGRLIGPAVTSDDDRSVWFYGGGSGLEPIAREGDAAPGTPADVNFFQFFDPVLNDAGQFAFRAFLSGDGTGSSDTVGIWSGVGSSSLTLVARAGDEVPSAGSGLEFTTIFFPTISDLGQIAFGSGLTDGEAGWEAVWTVADGANLLARTGDAAPGMGPEVFFDAFGGMTGNQPMLDSSGRVAYGASLNGPGLEIIESDGIWFGAGSEFELIAVTGNPAPGMGPDVSFSGMARPVLNGAGQVVFRASVTNSESPGPTGVGIWATDTSGQLQLIARAGDDAPGTEPGVEFSGFVLPVLNGAGQVAFEASAFAPGSGDPARKGIWATDRDGQLQLIAREGDLFDVNDDPEIEDQRTIEAVFISLSLASGNSDGRRSSFNDSGQIALKLNFTDGSQGIFISNVVAEDADSIFSSRFE